MFCTGSDQLKLKLSLNIYKIICCVDFCNEYLVPYYFHPTTWLLELSHKLDTEHCLNHRLKLKVTHLHLSNALSFLYIPVTNEAFTAMANRSMKEARFWSGLYSKPSRLQSKVTLFLITSIIDIPESNKKHNSNK